MPNPNGRPPNGLDRKKATIYMTPGAWAALDRARGATPRGEHIEGMLAKPAQERPETAVPDLTARSGTTDLADELAAYKTGKMWDWIKATKSPMPSDAAIEIICERWADYTGQRVKQIAYGRPVWI